MRQRKSSPSSQIQATQLVRDLSLVSIARRGGPPLRLTKRTKLSGTHNAPWIIRPLSLPPFRLKRIPSRGGGEFQISNVGAET
jgi:hypothetical protein